MSNPAYRRARRALWICVAVAVLLTGTLGAVARSAPAPLVGVAFAVLGLLLVATMSLAVRLILALTGRLPARDPQGCGPGPTRVNPADGSRAGHEHPEALPRLPAT